ncbi:MAG: hypothetical protein U9R02_15125 [Thermodesulfobacteriota bacterium]|nr:hypothetical protein [Thermodesulfobacteriota bacterium]
MNHALAWGKDEEAELKKPELLAEFFNAMEKIGFKNVDCYYKYGIFTMFGGKKVNKS